MNKIKFKHSPLSVKIIYIFFFIFFSIFAVLYLYPIIWAILNSFKSMEAYATDSMAFPKEWRAWHYISVFTEFRAVSLNGEMFWYLDMLVNSLWILVVNVFVNHLKSLLTSELREYQPLIFDGKGLAGSFILLGQSAIKGSDFVRCCS